MLLGGVGLFQGIGEQVAKEGVSYAKVLFSVTLSVEVSLDTKLAQAEGKCWNVHRLDTVALLPICFPCHKIVMCT